MVTRYESLSAGMESRWLLGVTSKMVTRCRSLGVEDGDRVLRLWFLKDEAEAVASDNGGTADAIMAGLAHRSLLGAPGTNARRAHVYYCRDID